MKPLLLSAALLLSLASVAQQTTSLNTEKKETRSEVSIAYNFGFSDRNFKFPAGNNFDRVDYNNARSYYDKGYLLKYNYAFVNEGRNRVSLGTGLGYSNSQHFQQIVESHSGYLVTTAVFDAKTITIPLSVAYERAVIGNKLFMEVSYSLCYNTPLKKQSSYTGGETAKFGYINYTYILDVKQKDYMSRWVALTSKLQLKKNFYLAGAVSYFGTKVVNYSCSYISRQAEHNPTTGASNYYTVSDHRLDNIDLKDNYIYLSLGLNYRF